jgi:ribosomal protein S18 acetylase RimI-like enzyme
MQSQNLVIRTMDENEVSLALEWAAAEGWNPGVNDAKCFYAADPNGFFLGEIAGEPVGCVSAVAYDDAFGFLGLYIVAPEHRGRGFGLKLWDAAMAYMNGRNVGLDGVLAQQANYRKTGFTLAYRNVRYRGTGGGSEPEGLIDLSSVPFEEIARYDATVFPAPRPNFLRRWIEQPNGAALGLMHNGRLARYGVLRPCREGFKIGPLFAADPQAADTLLRGLACRASGQPIFLDTPEANPAAIALAQSHGMQPVFETARMYTRGLPAAPVNDCYGVTTFELG